LVSFQEHNAGEESHPTGEESFGGFGIVINGHSLVNNHIFLSILMLHEHFICLVVSISGIEISEGGVVVTHTF